MEAQKTKDFVKGAIAAETENAKAVWGDTYHSEHEAWAVLAEEIEEANCALIKIVSIQNVMWNFVKKAEKPEGDIKQMRDNLHYLKDHAQEMATEAVQVAAVAQKYLDTLEALYDKSI